MQDIAAATVAHMEARQSAQRLGGNSERRVLRDGSAGSNATRLPSFPTSLGSVELEEDVSQKTSTAGDSALLPVLQKFTRDEAAVKYILKVRRPLYV